MCHILERLKEYIDNKGITVSAFEKSIGMSNASFGKQLKNKGAIGTDKLENILIVYSDISPLWLMTGQGDMLRSSDNDISESSSHNNNIIKLHGDYRGEVEITRPRIPFDAAAGSLSFAMNGVSSDECEQLPLIPTFPKYDFTIIARGDSMFPDFHSGDELACAFVEAQSFIQWGRAHVLDTAQGIVLKRIFNQKDAILCKSINSDYPDFEIPKAEIYHLAIVVGLIRHF